MRKLMMIAMMMVALALVVRADDAPASDDAARRHAAADQLLTLFNMDTTYDQAMKQAMSMATGMIDAQDIPEAEKANARKAVEASITVSMEKFSWKRMKSIFLDIYAEGSVSQLTDVPIHPDDYGQLVVAYATHTVEQSFAEEPGNYLTRHFKVQDGSLVALDAD